MNKPQQFCHSCRQMVDTYIKEFEHKVDVRNETITLHIASPACCICGGKIRDHKAANDIIALANEKYRKKHKLLTSDEIIAIREQYGLITQHFAKVIGIASGALNRYEHGGLQDIPFNNLMVLMRNRENLMTVYKTTKQNISPKIAKRIDKCLEESLDAPDITVDGNPVTKEEMIRRANEAYHNFQYAVEYLDHHFDYKVDNKIILDESSAPVSHVHDFIVIEPGIEWCKICGEIKVDDETMTTERSGGIS